MTSERQDHIFHLLNSISGEIIFWRSEMNRCAEQHGRQSKTYKEAWKVLIMLEASQKPIECLMMDFEFPKKENNAA